MSFPSDAALMARAIHLAERGRYTTDPNPRVGCVIAREDEIVGEGWHQRAGGPHAEVHALAAAGNRARGATAYVTLEPCSHHGRTPPCASALIDAGLARVVVAMEDPNPLVSGQGLAALRQAGIEVVTGVLAADALALNPGFVLRMREGRPFVRLKIAASLDGRTAMASGESQWITGVEARADVQRLRAMSSAIITGAGTVLADDPQLNVRSTELAAADDQIRQPWRLVIDTARRVPETAKLFCGEGRASRVVVTPRKDAGVHELCVAPSALGKVDLDALLRQLAAEGCNEVLVEAGPALAGAFLTAQQIDELWLYQAATLMGSDARPLAYLPWTELAQATRWQRIDLRVIGQDLRQILRPYRT